MTNSNNSEQQSTQVSTEAAEYVSEGQVAGSKSFTLR